MAAECQVTKREIRQVLCAHTQTTPPNSHPSSPLSASDWESVSVPACSDALMRPPEVNGKKAHSHSSPLPLLACTRGGKEKVAGTKLKRITVRGAGF